MEIEIFLSHKKASNMKFKYNMEPFVVNTTSSLSIIQNILKSMNFQLDKKLKYDPKHIISQTKTTLRMGTYEHKEDEALALMANKSYIEHGADMTVDEQEVDKGSEEKTMIEPVTGLSTPFKGEKTLKNPATDITNMEIDTISKKPRVSSQGKELVELDDDDDEHSIN